MITKQNLKNFAISVISILFICTNSVYASKTAVTLAWDANPESNISGYIIHYGTASSSYSKKINVGKVTQYKVKNLSKKTTYYFAVRAQNTDGKISEPSNEVKFKYKKKQTWWDKLTSYFQAPSDNSSAQAEQTSPGLVQEIEVPDSLAPSSKGAAKSFPTSTQVPKITPSIASVLPTTLLSWEPKDGVKKYIVHWGLESKNLLSSHQVETGFYLRIPKPEDEETIYYYTIEAVDESGNSSFSEEVVVKSDTQAMKKLPWLQSSFTSGTPEINRETGTVKVLIKNNTTSEKQVMSPPILCSQDGVEWKILIDQLDFDVGEVIRELIIPYPNGIAPPNLFIHIEGEPSKKK
jgi:hypothetical protein